MLWRYMEFAKFAFIAQEAQLHCPRGDQFEDKFEGSYPLKNEQDFSGCGYDSEEWKKYIYVSCWHSSTYESDAMWRLYGLSKDGVALVITREKLELLAKKYGYYLQDVKYIDYSTEKADIKIPTDVFHYKRRAFIHESEVRMIKPSYPHTGFEKNMPKMSLPSLGNELSPNGDLLHIEPEDFIEKVIVSPYSDNWFFKVVTKLAMSCGLSNDLIHKSELCEDPIYSK